MAKEKSSLSPLERRKQVSRGLGIILFAGARRSFVFVFLRLLYSKTAGKSKRRANCYFKAAFNV